MKLLPCPCCKGKPYFADVKTEQLRMWQVICEQCGLATAYNENRHISLLAWNLRYENKHLKQWVTLLSFLLPCLSLSCLLLGSLLGASFTHF